ncbi:MAG: hypothetical protein Q7T55_09245 [Solirubrobacteraceae bacterium]|nr:hypothetical protein [Solirubrobacteraceae bacterium]
MEIWQSGMKFEKKSYQIILKEIIQGEGEISRLVTIENGEIIEKPEDVELSGILTSDGFVIRGLFIK